MFATRVSPAHATSSPMAQAALTLALALALAGAAAAERCDVCHLSGYFHKVRPPPAPLPPPGRRGGPGTDTRVCAPHTWWWQSSATPTVFEQGGACAQYADAACCTAKTASL